VKLEPRESPVPLVSGAESNDSNSAWLEVREANSRAAARRCFFMFV
jgi:hypothetical protein